MAEGVILFGIQKLWELVSRESEQFQGVHEHVVELKCQLGRLQSLLKDADVKKHESERVRNFLVEVKDIVYDAEDIIETFLIRGEKKGIKKGVTRLACKLVYHKKIVSDIKGITKRISEVIEGMQSFGILQIIDGGRSLSLEDRQREVRQTYPNSSESNLVGMDQSVEDLVGQLVGNDNTQVVSISGMGGIGKTTLARQVFHHDMVRCHFDGFAWICVSQQFTQKHVWQRILQELKPDDGESLQMDEYTRQGKLFQLLETDRYLIVLDDIWKPEDWDRIKEVFPQKRGWKMLLTSRNESVGLHADPTCYSFRPRSLTPEQSWTLCQRLAFPRRDDAAYRVDEELDVLGKEMVTHCGGLPLAVKVLGGLLATKHTVPEWKRVYDNIRPHVVGGSGLEDNNFSSVYRVLSLSYEDLPMGLKHCFLYLAHFPEDHKIDVETLFNYWVAEGLVMIHRATVRDNAESYLEELVRRNMVIAERSYLTSRIESCQMHDIMRVVCLSKAEEENFIQIVKAPTSTSTINAQSSRRLSVHSSSAFEIMGHKKTKKVRSFLLFKSKEKAVIQSAPDFGSLPFLRVLDLSSASFQGGKLPSSIGQLIHLRFLSLYRAGVSHLPYSLRNLKLLLYLNLGVHGVSVHVPNVLKEMRELRYLFLPFLMDDKTKLELGDLVNLETLSGYTIENSSVSDLLRMTKLRTLTVHSLDECTLETLSSSLCESRELEELSLHEVLHNGHDEGKFVLDSINLKYLTVAIHMARLPNHHQFPPNLAHICLRYCCMVEDPMPILEKLLHLKWVELSYQAFKGKRMVCSKDGFPQLYELKLCGQDDLKEWIIEEGSMPSLHTLTISQCRKLKELPDGLRYITSLTILEMNGEWKYKLSEGSQDYYKVQHIHHVKYAY